MLMQSGGMYQAPTLKYVLMQRDGVGQTSMQGGGEGQGPTQQHMVMQGGGVVQAHIQQNMVMKEGDVIGAPTQQHMLVRSEWGGGQALTQRQMLKKGVGHVLESRRAVEGRVLCR
jgi:hypothetical protein